LALAFPRGSARLKKVLNPPPFFTRTEPYTPADDRRSSSPGVVARLDNLLSAVSDAAGRAGGDGGAKKVELARQVARRKSERRWPSEDLTTHCAAGVTFWLMLRSRG